MTPPRRSDTSPSVLTPPRRAGLGHARAPGGGATSSPSTARACRPDGVDRLGHRVGCVPRERDPLVRGAVHAHRCRGQGSHETQRSRPRALHLVHGIARDHERLTGAEGLLAAIEIEDAVTFEDHNRFLAVVAVDGSRGPRVDGLDPYLKALEAVKRTGYRAVGQAREPMLLGPIVRDDHGGASLDLVDIDTLLYRNVMSSPPFASGPRAPGRPRDPDIEEAILGAAARLLAEQGYGRMSIGGVAAAAGVSRPTIYRRYSSKADLATAALASRIDEGARPPVDLEVEPALVRALQHLARRLRGKHSMALVGSLLVEEHQTPELIALFRKRVWRVRSRVLHEILERARSRGQIRPEADAEVAVGMMIGALYAAHLAMARIPRDWPDRVVRAALEGLR